MLPLFMPGVAYVAPYQQPSEISSLSRDYAEDLLCYFSWALDIKFTEAEKARFIKERLMEWESGNQRWQCMYIGNYWALLTLPPNLQVGNKEKMKKELIDFVVANAKAGQPDILWIQKRLGQDDEVETLPISKARRAPLERMRYDAEVDSVEGPGFLSGITLKSSLTALQVANSIAKLMEMLQMPLTPEQRQEFVERAKKHWRKNRSDWDSSSTSMNANPISYINNYASYAVYKYERDQNANKIREFVDRGERDAVWVMNIYDKAVNRVSLIASQPEVNRDLLNDYTVLWVEQINEIVGRKVLIADVPTIVKMQKEIVSRWPTMPQSKKQAILSAAKNLWSFRNAYPHCAPLYKEHLKYLWSKEMVSAVPELKPAVEARAQEFAKIAKKDPDWKEKMEQINDAALQAYLQRKQKEYDRQLAMMDRVYDSVVFSGKMNAINNAILRAPAGTSVRVDIRP